MQLKISWQRGKLLVAVSIDTRFILALIMLLSQ